VKMLDARKTRMIGLPCGEKNGDDMLSLIHLIPERPGPTDRIAISISRVSMLTRDNNGKFDPPPVNTKWLTIFKRRPEYMITSQS